MLFSTVGPSFRRLVLIKDCCPVFEPGAFASKFDDFTFCRAADQATPLQEPHRQAFSATFSGFCWL